MSKTEKSFMQRAAERRAAVLSVLNNNATSSFTAEQLAERLPTNEKNDMTAFKSLLYSMQKNGLIMQERSEPLKQLVYFSTKGSTEPGATQPAAPRKQRRHREHHEHPSMLVDYVKSSGRVRVTMGGIVLEIGVVES